MAFNTVPYPGDDNIATGPRTEYGMVASKFKGVRWQDWKENPSQFLGESPYSALFWMTDLAFHYYLPLFMIQALLDYKNANILPESIFISFLEPANGTVQRLIKSHWGQCLDDYLSGTAAQRNRVNARYKMMTREQLQSILDFMKFVKQRYGHDYGWSNEIDRITNKLEALMNS